MGLKKVPEKLPTHSPQLTVLPCPFSRRLRFPTSFSCRSTKAAHLVDHLYSFITLSTKSPSSSAVN